MNLLKAIMSPISALFVSSAFGSSAFVSSVFVSSVFVSSVFVSALFVSSAVCCVGTPIPARAAEALSPESASNSRTQATSVPLPPRLLRLPLTRQSTDYSCGAAAMQSLLGYFGDVMLETDLMKALGTNSTVGTNWKDLMQFAKSKRYSVWQKEGMPLSELKRSLNAGNPVLVAIQAWPDKPCNLETGWGAGHYVVAVGYDRANVYFMDPWLLGNYGFLPEKTFEARWHDRQQGHDLVHWGMSLRKTRQSYNPRQAKLIE